MLDILRIVIASSNDDEILEPADKEQFSFVHKAKVSGPKERPFIRVGAVGLEGLDRFFAKVPITVCYAGALYPNLANLIWCARDAKVWVDDQHLLARPGGAAANQASSAGGFRVFSHGRDYAILSETLRVHG